VAVEMRFTESRHHKRFRRHNVYKLMMMDEANLITNDVTMNV
jgi:hypothetical protein